MANSNAVPVGAVARVVGIKTNFINTNVGGVIYLPQRVAIVGQGASNAVYSTDKRTITSAVEAGTLYGFGSPIHLAALQLLPQNGDGVQSVPVTVYPLVDDAAGAAAVGAIAPTGAVTKAGVFRLTIGGQLSSQFGVAIGDTVADIVASMLSAINGVLNMPVTAADGTTEATLTAKWEGASGNAIKLSIEGPTDTGVTFALTNPTAGAANPEVDAALAQFGDVWESVVLNCLDMADTVALDAYQVFGEGRWGALTKKPLLVFTGNPYDTVAEATAITDNRKDDRINSVLPNPGSADLPFVSAAGMVARIALSANNNPARDFGRLPASYVEPGADALQWDYTTRELAVNSGLSTVEVRDGVVTISDVVTMYRPDGDPLPAYRFAKNTFKLQNVLFNLDLQFNNAEWDGAPLIPDDQPTANPDAKKPKNARAVMDTLAYNLGLNAIISDVPYTQANRQVEIDSQNPDRLNGVFPVKLSGNVNIQSYDLNWGFYFGQQTIIN